jgi:autotransporter-associated beta strand protein
MLRRRERNPRALPVAATIAAILPVAAALPHAAGAQVLAFPEAQGFGRFATGARTSLSSAGVYHVTNLNDSGAGSFRDAVGQPNRFVVFDVGGIVNLQSTLVVKNNVTIAGQTAPGGFSLYGQKVSFSGASNVVSRHIAIRKGQAGIRDDASGAANGANMMFDHMSVTWGVDETFSLNWDGKGSALDNITIQNSVIAQGEDRLGHSAGGLMTLPEGNHFSIVRSLFADNVTRNPKVRGENEYVNNIVYGWENAAYIMGDTTSMDSHAIAVGNYFITGPVAGSGPFTSGTANFHIYGADNYYDGNRDGVLDGSLVTSYPGADVVATPFAFPTTASMTARQALGHVLANVGPDITRDAVDARIVQEVASYGTLGGVILRETDLFPGYGTDPKYLSPRARLVDTDGDGMPDNWETANGLNPADATDWKGLSGGYTRLELYLNELGGDGTSRTTPGGAWTSAATWGGTLPTLADTAIATGGVTHASGNAFARRATLDGSSSVTGGTLDVFDTLLVGAAANGSLSISGGTVTAGQVVLGATGRAASLALSTGGTLQTGTITAGGGTGSFDWNGGTIRATGAPNVTVATTLGGAGGTFDTSAFSGTYSGRITGDGALTKTGTGTLTLSGNNAYIGGTTVSGNLKLAHNNAAGTGPIAVTSAGGTVQLANGVTVANDLVTAYNFEILDVPDAGASATFAGDVTTSGSRQVRIQATGAGATLNLTGAINSGSQLFILKTGNVVLAGTGSITGTGGVVGRATGATSLTLRDNATFSIGGFSMGGGQPLTSSTITVHDAATLSAGAGNLDLLATSTATASATVNLDGGTATVASFTKTSTGPAQTATLNFNGGTLSYGGSATNPNFLPALPGLTANLKSGGARVNDNGQAIAITQPLVHDPALASTPDGGLTKSGAGTLTLAGINTYTGPTTVNTGTLQVAGSIATSAGVTVGTGALLDLAATQTLRSLTLNSGGHADLRDNALVIDYDPLAPSPRTSIRAALAAGLLTSSSLTPATAIGYAEAADLLGTTGGTFAGQAADATSLLLRPTASGDATLDGRVNFDDLLALAKNYNQTAAIWYQGDFNYDGTVNFDDLLILAKNYNTALPTSPLPGAPAEFSVDLAAAAAAVPEPSTTLTMLTACGFALAGRRRRRWTPS